MSKNLWKSLLVAPAALGMAAAFSTSVVAQEMSTLEEVNLYTNEGNSTAGQVNSVSQLSDVRPTDWAYQALQSLVERYGCIAGYPDGTYRGNRAMTRYEFAAGLNACLDNLLEIVGVGLDEGDLATIRSLQEEFAAELATLRGRVDSLEARVGELEANSFSTTTKLNGETIFSIAGVGQDDSFDDEELFFGYRVRLNLDTSFTGEDRLRARLQARDTQQFGGDPLGFSYGTGDSNDIVLDNLFYEFPLGDAIDVIIGANSLGSDDFVASTISPVSSSVGDFGDPIVYDVYNNGDGDAGAGVIITLAESDDSTLSLDLGYTSADGNNPRQSDGLFNGDYTALSQLTYLSGFVDAGLYYMHGYSGSANSVFSSAATPYESVNNTYGGQINFKFDGFEIGGGLAFIDNAIIGSANADDDSTWNVTLALPDLGGEGNMLGAYFGQVSAVGYNDFIADRGNIYTAETYYMFQVNDNISLTPAIIWYGLDGVDDTVIGALRTTFSF